MKLHRINALLLKYYYISKNSLDRVFDLFYWPLIDILIWGFTTAYIKEVSDLNLLSVLLGGIILWVFVWRSSVDLAIYVLEDFWGKNLYNLFTSPMRSSELVSSIVIFASARSFISFSAQAIVAYLIYHFNILSINIFAIALLSSILLLFGWAMGLFITGFIFRYGSRIQVFAWSVVWIVQPFSCVFYPLKTLPVWAQNIAIILPTAHIFEALRAIVNDTAVNWYSIAYALFSSLVFLVLSAYFIKSSIQKAKKTGLLTRFE